MEVVADGGKLANVFIYIKEGLSGTFPAGAASPEINQDGCEYIPHVLGVQTGQPVTFRNSDGLLHNIKAQPANNRPFNISQPTNMTSNQTFNTPEVMVPVQCDVHGWMTMYIGVTNHPYFAVSAADGTFTIANVPPGTYTIEAWHERYGAMTQQVTVDPNGASTVTFEYNASMAGAHVPLGQPIDPHGSHDGTAHAHTAAGVE
jgi:plastocyanin